MPPHSSRNRMPMTDKLEMEILRGKDAAQLLEHPLLAEAFSLIEKDLIEQWQNSPARDEKGREILYLSQCLLKRLQSQLYQVVETGKFAQASLAQQIGQKLKSAFS